ncbi:MAG TPA: 2-C-methyl-D-erythritol 4-phosphate cytidylyltransferase [Rhodanobacteraceae bacterium]|nr:2-C-methyl-D-erythritol 4-phosphate cytidylyltransferase [Rhodanobacteraceae bacterium]
MGIETRQGGYWCVVPAAGNSQRFGASVPKQYQPIAGATLLEHTLQRLAAHPRVAGLMVVLAADDPHWARTFPALAGASADTALTLRGKPLRSVPGGATRADSTLAGLMALPAMVRDPDFVLVHDAARPCLRADDLTRLIEGATQKDGGLLAAPLRDTLKRSDAFGHCLSTEPRKSRWRAFTPQIFRRGELTQALLSARSEQVEITDEAMAMEHSGHTPLLVEGADDNIKVTTPADLAMAEFLLARMG